VFLHDWMFAPPVIENPVAEAAPGPEEGADAQVAAVPALEPGAADPVASVPESETPAARDEAKATQGYIGPDAAPEAEQATPPSSQALAPMPEPAAPMALPYTQDGPETAAVPAVPTFEADIGAAPAEDAAWLRNAIPATFPAGKPMIAVVIDDVGVNTPQNTARVVALPAPMTLAIMTYAPNAVDLAARASAAGHELLVHVPMEPEDGALSTGPNAMRTDLPVEDLRRRLEWALTRFDGYVGINNHMGSEFTASAAGMTIVLEEVRRRGLLFLDSKTTASSAGAVVAERLDVPFAERDVFLDNENSVGAVWEQLGRLEQVARGKGYAVAIGHPHDGTLDALAAWLPTARDRGFVLVPISQIVRLNQTAATN
jgi:polysaccharide deacetylase 2 family uncharacterized protein YibQ